MYVSCLADDFVALTHEHQMMSKSANYCYSHLSDNTGLLLLCEVAAKPFFEKKDSDYYADQGCKTASARYVSRCPHKSFRQSTHGRI